MSRNPFIMINARNLRNYMSINVVFTGKHPYYGLYAEFSMVKRPVFLHIFIWNRNKTQVFSELQPRIAYCIFINSAFEI